MADSGTVDQAQRIAEGLLVSLPRRWQHVQGVAAASSRLVTGLPDGDAWAVVAAAWLHDVGYAPSLVRTGFHPIDGAVFAREAGFPESVVSLVAFHSGAPVEAAERSLCPELSVFVEPPGVLLDAVTCADMTTSPEGVPVAVGDRVSEILSRYGAESPVHRAVSRSAGDLVAAVCRCQERVAAEARVGRL